MTNALKWLYDILLLILAPCQYVAFFATTKTPTLRIEKRTRKVDDGTGGLIDQTFKFPVWFEPISDGKTPMCEALVLARKTLGEFVTKYPGCYPPLAINITDGMATDGNPLSFAEDLRQLGSADGKLLLFNAHVSSLECQPVEFPDKEDGLPDNFARLLFRMSSLLPEQVQAAARTEGFATSADTRGFVFNADLVSVVRFMDLPPAVPATELAQTSCAESGRIPHTAGNDPRATARPATD